MIDLSASTYLSPEQEAIREKCFHPSGAFVEFPQEDVERSIPDRFEMIVRTYPDRLAVKTKDRTLTFGELNKSANRLAHTILAERGQGQEPVGLFLPQGAAQIVAILAVLKAGKMSLQLDPTVDPSRTAHLLNESQPQLIVIDGETDSNECIRGNSKTRLINLIDMEPGISDQNPGLSVPSDACAYIRYTSGSTGQAKGALISHRAVLHGVMNYTNSCHFCPDDRLVQAGANSIKRYIFTNLLNGATLCPLDIREVGIHHLANWLLREQITIFRSFPTVFRYLASTLSGPNSFSKLRLIRLAGEPLYARDVELYQKHFSSECLLINSYSSTETGNISTYYIDKNTEITGTRVPVGYPIKGKEVRVIDDRGNNAEFNQIGEIVVKSRFLPSGYWRQTEATKEKFETTSGDPEVRIYRTGDLGQLSEDGCLLHLGRKDARVKIRNFRVDIGEVEATLANHPGVTHATVTAKEQSSGDTILIGYFVPKSEPAPTVTSLRDFLAGKLPDYMIPSLFVKLDKPPISASGKLDPKALPDPENSRPELDTPYVIPKTPVEEQLSKIWAEVLSIDRVGMHDNFFDLGGHSLAATRVVSQVLKHFHIEVPLKSLFDSPTVAHMATAITEHQGKKLGEEELDRILTELESMTDEEAKDSLTGEGR